MPIEVVELHHHGIRIGESDDDVELHQVGTCRCNRRTMPD